MHRSPWAVSLAGSLHHGCRLRNRVRAPRRTTLLSSHHKLGVSPRKTRTSSWVWSAVVPPARSGKPMSVAPPHGMLVFGRRPCAHRAPSSSALNGWVARSRVVPDLESRCPVCGKRKRASQADARINSAITPVPSGESGLVCLCFTGETTGR